MQAANAQVIDSVSGKEETLSVAGLVVNDFQWVFNLQMNQKTIIWLVLSKYQVSDTKLISTFMGLKSRFQTHFLFCPYSGHREFTWQIPWHGACFSISPPPYHLISYLSI